MSVLETEVLINLLIRRVWASFCVIIGGFQLLVLIKLFPSFSCHFSITYCRNHCSLYSIMNLYLKSVKNLQEIVTSVSYISLNLFCYITSLQDADRVLIPIHKVRALRILGFYTPYPSSLPRYSFDDPFPNNVRTLSAFPQYQKKL